MKVTWSIVLLSLFIFSCSHYEQVPKYYSYESRESGVRELASDTSCADILKRVLSNQEDDFLTVRRSLFGKMENLDDSERFGLINAIESFSFVDYKFASRELDEIRTKAVKLEEATFPFAFNEGGSSNYKEKGKKGFAAVVNLFKTRKVQGYEEVLLVKEGGGAYIPPQGKQKAFENFLDARMWLTERAPAFDLESLLETHRLMMKGGVEKVPDENLGVIRNNNWYGNVPSGSAISKEEYEVVKANPYLDYSELSERSINGTTKYAGKIYYPTINNVKPEVLERIQDSHPEVYAKILEHQETNSGGTNQELTRNMVNALTEERLNWFVLQRDQIGEIDSSEKFSELIDLIATLQRDVVSIHPFPNGNGRTTREFLLNYALIREGFFPPRISDPNLDMYSSLEDWKEIIVRGIESTERLYSDLSNRIDLGLDISNSPELYLPYFKRTADLDLKKYGRSDIYDNDRVADVDARQFLVFLDYYLKEKPEVKELLSSKPEQALRRIESDYADFFKRNNVDYVHKKEGLQEVSLFFVDDDFKSLFGNNTYTHYDVWKAKMDQWYMDQTVWRGLSYRNKEMSEDEIVGMFSQFHYQMTSNNVARKINASTPQENIKKLVFEDFDQFNDDLYGEGIVEMAKDHSETGPKYGVSYGYSTSKNRTVGKAFSMGAMVVAEYGKHAEPELQALLKSRILIGAKRAKKDVDLGRLKQVRSEFSYKYGRQQEVMGIGATEPDAIEVVQTIDAQGDVILSYVRNKHDPAKIHIYASEADDVDDADEATLVKIITLE